MVVARNAYKKGTIFVRGILAVFTVFSGFIALFFTAAPRLWGHGNNQNLSSDFFSQNVAHAEVPAGGDSSSGGDSSGDSGDSGCDSGADSGGCCGK